VIDMATLRSIGPVGPDGVWVEAGASWLEVLEATLPSGLRGSQNGYGRPQPPSGGA